MPKTKLTVDVVLEKLEKGERLGIDEALELLSASKQLLTREAEEKFFNAARRDAKKNPPLATLDCETISAHKKTPSEIAKVAQASLKSLVQIEFSGDDLLETIESCIRAVAEHKTVVALSPSEILALASRSTLKVTETVKRLALAGLGIASGKLTAKGSDDAAIDEYFSVIMQLHKFKIKTSVWLPMSLSEREKVLHLAKLREFEDRTRCFMHVFLYIESKPNDKDLLRTVALSRLMLDNVKHISLAEYGIAQVSLNDALFKQCVELGVNLASNV